MIFLQLICRPFRAHLYIDWNFYAGRAVSPACDSKAFQAMAASKLANSNMAAFVMTI
jgi:hypothetical protein